MKKQQNLLQGAMVLLISMILSKIIGAFFKMPLGNLLQQSGMAYFNASYNLFTTIYALTVTGLTTSVARMVAECSADNRYSDCKVVLKQARKIFIFLGLAGTILMFVGAKLFARLSGLENSVYSIMVMAPAIFFSCMMATYRGYYEGLRNMVPSAVSEVCEVISKLIIGFTITSVIIKYGQESIVKNQTLFGVKLNIDDVSNLSQSDINALIYPFASAGAMLGVTISTFVGFLYLYIMYKVKGEGFEGVILKDRTLSNKEVTFCLLKTALPITLSAVIINLTSVIDLFSVMNRLNYAIIKNPDYFNHLYGNFIRDDSVNMAEYIYGGYTMALPIFNLVPSFTALFGKSALPNVTQAWINKDKRALYINIRTVFKMTSLISFPAGIGIMVLSKQISMLLYPNVQGAFISVGLPLQALGISAIFLSLISPLYAILQAVGRFDLPVKFMLIGASVKVALNFLLVGIPRISIQGAVLSTAMCYFIILILCLVSLKRIIGIDFKFNKIILKNGISAIICGLVAYYLNHILVGKVFLLVSISCAMIAYFICILILRALTEDEVKMLPAGDRILAKLKKYKMVDVKN